MQRNFCVNYSRRTSKLTKKVAALTFCIRCAHFSTTSRHAWLPRRLLLVRHGESAANVDRKVYSQLPDWRIPLTERGRAQSLDCGRRLRRIIKDEKLYIYYSPYERSRQTLNEIRKSFDEDQIQGEREDERLREQEIGNYQPMELMDKTWAERNEYGRLYYRFPCGESGADVGDRVSMFFDSLLRERIGLSIPNMNEGVMLDNSYYHIPPFPSDDVYPLQSHSPDFFADEHHDNVSSCNNSEGNRDEKSINSHNLNQKCSVDTLKLLENENEEEYLYHSEEEEEKQEQYEEELKAEHCPEEVRQSSTSHVVNTNMPKSNKYVVHPIEECNPVETEKHLELPSEISEKHANVMENDTTNNIDNVEMKEELKANEFILTNSAYCKKRQSYEDEENTTFNNNNNYNNNNMNTIQDDHNVVIISHGLLIRLFISRWYRLSTEVFETMCNPPNCSIIVMERNDNIGRMVMTDISKELFGSDPLLQMIRFDGVEDAEWHKHQLQSILNPNRYAFDRPVEDDDENHYSKSTAHNTAVGAPTPPRRLTHLRDLCGEERRDNNNNSNADNENLSHVHTSYEQHLNETNANRKSDHTNASNNSTSRRDDISKDKNKSRN